MSNALHARCRGDLCPLSSAIVAIVIIGAHCSDDDKDRQRDWKDVESGCGDVYHRGLTLGHLIPKERVAVDHKSSGIACGVVRCEVECLVGGHLEGVAVDNARELSGSRISCDLAHELRAHRQLAGVAERSGDFDDVAGVEEDAVADGQREQLACLIQRARLKDVDKPRPVERAVTGQHNVCANPVLPRREVLGDDCRRVLGVGDT
jgi:hypothetical protein